MGRSSADVLAQHGIGLTEDELAHYGKAGMKWGRRKKKEAAAKAADEEHKVKTMSDDELKARINRIKLEKEYKKLTSPEISEGRKLVSEILKDVGKQQAKNYLNGQAEKLISGGAKGAIKAAVKGAAKQSATRQVVQFTPRF
jgi:hypothetical protein